MGILDRAVKASEIKEDNYKLKVLLLGASGSGKTQALETLPGKGYVLDTDGRAAPLVGNENIQVLSFPEEDPKRATAFKDLVKAKEEFWALVRNSRKENGEPFPYDWICLDGLTSVSKLAMNWSLTLTTAKGDRISTMPGGAPGQAHYMPAMHNIDRLISSLLPLPCHIIVTGHESLYEDESEGKLYHLPKVVGRGLRDEIGSLFNETYLANREQKGSSVRYVWQTTGVGRTSCFKSSLNKGGKLWKDPVIIDLDEKPAGFAKLLALRFQKKGGEEDK